MNHRFRITCIEPETPEVYTVHLSPAAENAVPYIWKAGQFALVRLPSGQERPWTIATSPLMGTGPVFTVKRVGKASRELTELAVGSEIMLSDPMGSLSLPDNAAAEKHLFLASGIGITPMTAMIRDLLIRCPGTDSVLVCCMASEEDFVFRDHFAMLECERPEFRYHAFIKFGGAPGRECGRLDAERLASLVPDVVSRRVYACGSTGFMRGAASWIQCLGVAPNRFLCEAFG